jgi:hypothetical protein
LEYGAVLKGQTAVQFLEDRVDVHAFVGHARRVSGLVVDANDKYGFPGRIRDHGSIDANVGRKVE